MTISRHYLGLALAIALGTILRFWNLDYKPLWLDEVITALFTLGKTYNDIPLETVFSLNRLPEIFSFNSAVSCPQIAGNIASQSTHPPLFFCLMNYWLAKLSTDYSSLTNDLRSLPALFGVSALAAIYYLNRVAFGKSAGLMAAALMAVSPFGVYISQEARHYTLPVLLITLSLLGLIQIQQDIQQEKIRPICWVSWVVVNTIGLYIHYFFILALVAELVTLVIISFKSKIEYFYACLALIFWFLPFIFFVPWLSALFGHFHRPETSWLPAPHNIAPIYQTLAAWILMAIALPIENQPIWIIIPASLLMILFFGWLVWQVFQGLKQLISQPTTSDITLSFGIFIICVLLEFFAIVYLLGKDITIAPRYNFVYYPAFCALIAAALVNSKLTNKKLRLNHPHSIILTVGIISCILVVNGLAFLKPYNPQTVAQNLLQESDIPSTIVVGYNNSQDIALGMSFALAVDKFDGDRCQIDPASCSELVFFDRNSGYDSVWQNISKLTLPKSPANLWIVAPGLKRQNYPNQLTIADRSICTVDPNNYYRIGIPYQLYRCK